MWLQRHVDQDHPADDGDHGPDSAGKEITTWNLAGVVPVKWTGPTLDIMGNAIAMETLEVAYERDHRLRSALGGAAARRHDRRPASSEGAAMVMGRGRIGRERSRARHSG